MSTVILLSLTAALNPTLIAASSVMMLLPAPVKLMIGYLSGALLTSVTLGLVIVFSLRGSSAVSTTRHTLSPAVDIALGAIALVLARVVAGARADRLIDRRRERRLTKADKQPPRWQRALSNGSARMTFVVGALLTLPGASYLAGLAAIHKLHDSNAATVLIVIAFNIVMLVLLEVPLLSFAIAPEWTPGAIERAKVWLSRRARRIAIRGFFILGALLILKGVIELILN